MASLRLLGSAANKVARIQSTKAFSTTAVAKDDYSEYNKEREIYFKYINLNPINLFLRLCAPSGMNDPLEHATGLEKYELLAKQAGNDVSKL